jgi:tetratricopeptide (TPR) repeat protein
MLQLGRKKLNQQDFETAESILLEAIGQGEDIYGPGHPMIAQLHNMMGHTRYYQRDYDGAQTWYLNALALHEDSIYPETVGWAKCLWNLAHTCWALEDFIGAEARFNEAIDLLREAPDPARLSLPTYLGRLGRLFGVQGDWDAALPLFEESLRKTASIHGGSHFITARAKALLGECLGELGRFEEGEALLLEARADFGEDALPFYVTHALFSLEKLYTAWDKPDLAAEYTLLLSERSSEDGDSQD